MAKATITDATTQVYEILKGFKTDERKRIVDAVLTLLGDPAVKNKARSDNAEDNQRNGDNGTSDDSPLNAKAKSWMKKYGLSIEELSNNFHFDNGTVTCIELAGNAIGKRLRTIDTYLLHGIAALLTTGEPSFTDDDARKLCQHFGCYDSPNHSKYLKEFKNNITGTAAGGWKLTVPGLAAGAKLLKPQDAAK